MIFISSTGERTNSLIIEGFERPNITPRVIANGFLQYLLTSYDSAQEASAELVSGFLEGVNDRQEIISGKALDKLFDLVMQVGLGMVDPKNLQHIRIETMIGSGASDDTIRSNIGAMLLTDMSEGLVSVYYSDRLITLNHEGYESSLVNPITRSFSPVAYPTDDTELYSGITGSLSEEDLEKLTIPQFPEELQVFGRSPTETSRQAGVLVKEYRDMESAPIVTTFEPEYLEAVRASLD